MTWSVWYALPLLSLMILLTACSAGPDVDEHWRVPADAERLENPIEATQESIGLGIFIFERRCSVCHGPQGRGDGPSSLSLNVFPTDLTVKEVQNQADGILFWKITTGRGAMPNWELILHEEERWHVINYIRAISK